MWFAHRSRSATPHRWHTLSKPRDTTVDSGADPVVGPAVPDDYRVHAVLDLALRIGEVQMSSGAGASDVTATILAVTAA